jgi:hypothetical protein
MDKTHIFGFSFRISTARHNPEKISKIKIFKIEKKKSFLKIESFL